MTLMQLMKSIKYNNTAHLRWEFNKLHQFRDRVRTPVSRWISPCAVSAMWHQRQQNGNNNSHNDADDNEMTKKDKEGDETMKREKQAHKKRQYSGHRPQRVAVSVGLC